MHVAILLSRYEYSVPLLIHIVPELLTVRLSIGRCIQGTRYFLVFIIRHIVF